MWVGASGSVPGPMAAVPAAAGPAERMRRGLLDLLFPPRCALCHQAGSPLCPACLSRIRSAGERAGPEHRAASGIRLISGLRSAGIYKPPLSLAIREFKYRGRTDLAPSLGALMARAWQGVGIRPDFVAPVPLHDNRLRERGYNQAELLAIELCRAMNLPLLARGHLIRQRDTEHQVLLGLEERRQNVSEAFVWTGPPVAGATVLLIDDVATTGSTLEACAEALSQAGAGTIWALTVARAVAQPEKESPPVNASRRKKEG